MRSIILALVACFSVAQATTINNVPTLLLSEMTQVLSVETRNWKVGDNASYKLNMGGFINGTMITTVKKYDSNGLLIAQDMDLGFAGKQNCEMLVDPGTGETKSLVCNGQNQEVGKNNIEVVEVKEATITVPAGTFQAIHVIAKNLDNNSEIQQWANPRDIPVFGMIKTVSQSQFGPVTIELTSFKKN